ncbi:MAG: methylated-DNA--[protein]-cysteine S-methyltransferase [Treponema sp.]|jgi:methylated-DNA-[protein]-cysteine S-methyltransferase|nr:methylated-DNA--[protein]-cysteine S-methyltransferase [Treponema sp.]
MMRAITGKGTIYSFTKETPLGKILAAAQDNAIIGLWFFKQKYFPPGTASWQKEPSHLIFDSLNDWLDDYFSKKKPEIPFQLLPQGTDFQQAVWKQLLKIPYGKTSTYGAIAAKLSTAGKKASAQAVGGAVGHNPISLLIPCHRVLGADGSLTGYAGGLEKKWALLELERS